MPKSSPVTPDQLLAHAGFVRALARGLLADEALVEDVVQETYVRALQSGPRRPEALTAWLRAVTRNLSFKALRGQGRRAQREETAARSERLPSTLDLVDRETSLERVVQAVKSLPEHYRRVVMLRYFEDLPPRKIALEVGLPVNTVRMRLHRALKLLRGRLDDEYGGDRQRWMGALAVMAGLPRADAGAAAGLSGAGAGWWTAVVAAGLSVLAAGALWWTRGAAPSEDAAAPTDAAPDAGVAIGVTRPAPPDDGTRVSLAPLRGPRDPAPGDAPLARVFGRVVDARGAPVAGAAIHLDTGTTGPQERGVSGADGRFSVLVPEEDRARLSGSALRALVAARAAGHAPSGIVTVPATGEVELRMRGPEAVLRGRVTDPSGAPLAGVRVDVGERLRLGYGHLGMQSRSAASYPGRLYPGLRVVKTGALFQGFEQGRGYLGAQVLLADGAQSRLLPAASTLTGADGRYELRGLEAGAAPLELCCAGYSPVHDALVLCADEPVEHDVTLRPAARLRGELRRVDGPLPAGSTVVYAYPTDERRRQSTRARRGRYLFDQLDAGRYLLYAEVVEGGRAVAAASAHVDVRPGRGAVWNAELSSAGRVEGRLVGPGGQGLAGWQVEVALEENPPISIVVTRSAEDGSFDLGILPPRPWQVRALAPGAELGLPLASATGTGAPAEPLLLRVSGADARLARVRGQLRLPDGALAPPGFDVLLYPCAGTGERAVLAEVRGAAGEFESPPLPPGAYHVVLPELGLCHVLEAPIDLAAEDVALGDLALPRTGRLSVAAPAQAPQSARVRIERVLGGARGLRLAIFDGRADLPLRAEVGPGLYAVSFPELERQGAPDFVRVESLDVSGR